MDLLDLVPCLLTEAMRQQGWYSERELARHLGCAPQSVANWRNGTHIPAGKYVAKLASYAQFPPDRALIAVNILQSEGKSAAIYRRILNDMGGLPPFPPITKTAA